jgi:hypothetical protein
MSDILEAPPDPPDKVPATQPAPRPTASAPALSGSPRAALAPTRTALWTFAGVGGLASAVGLLAGPSAQVVIGPFLPLVVAGTLVSVVLALRSPRTSSPHTTGTPAPTAPVPGAGPGEPQPRPPEAGRPG